MLLTSLHPHVARAETASVSAGPSTSPKRAEKPQVAKQVAEKEARIAELVAGGKSADALPLAVFVAKKQGANIEAWKRVRTFAEWNSKAEEALLALRNLVRLVPSDKELRLALAQRLLWAKKTDEALPHAKWLMKNDPSPSATTLEVCAWVFLEEKEKDAAEEALARWTRASPKDPKPRWIVADLTHWSARWREAKEQYEHLEKIGDNPAKRKDRVERLRLDHPTRVGAFFSYWSDSIDVSYLTAGGEAQVQLPARLVSELKVERGRWTQSNERISGSLSLVRAVAKLRAEVLDELSPEVGGGVEVDSEGNTAPVFLAGGRFTLFGKVFGSAHFHYDRLRLSFEGAVADIRAYGPKLTVYAEPHPWIFTSAEGLYYILSDGNERRSGLVAIGAHNPHAFQIEPRIFGQYFGYKESREAASPYFTPSSPWTYGGDLTLRYRIPDILKVFVAVGGVFQQGSFAVLPSAGAEYLAFRHLLMKANVAYIGAPQYKQLRVDASLSYLF